MSLTCTKIPNIKPASKPFELTDAQGLYLLVTSGGSRLWFLKYRFNRKESRIALGAYPQVSLPDAQQRMEVRAAVSPENLKYFMIRLPAGATTDHAFMMSP